MKKSVNSLNLSHFIDETHKQIIAKIRTDIIHGLDIRMFSNSTTKAKLQMVATISHNKTSTPPCYETVTWIVFGQHIKISPLMVF
jgi:hypothetical protein